MFFVIFGSLEKSRNVGFPKDFRATLVSRKAGKTLGFPVYFNGKPRIAILIQNHPTELQGRAHFTIWIPQTHGLFFPTLLTPIIACAESILNLVKYCHILEFGFNPFPYPFTGFVAYTAALHYSQHLLDFKLGTQSHL